MYKCIRRCVSSARLIFYAMWIQFCNCATGASRDRGSVCFALPYTAKPCWCGRVSERFCCHTNTLFFANAFTSVVLLDWQLPTSCTHEGLNDGGVSFRLMPHCASETSVWRHRLGPYTTRLRLRSGAPHGRRGESLLTQARARHV